MSLSVQPAGINPRLRVIDAFVPALAALIVSGYLPVARAPGVVTVRIEDPPADSDVGLNVAVAPAGTLLAVSETVPLKPVTSIWLAALLPGLTVSAPGV